MDLPSFDKLDSLLAGPLKDKTPPLPEDFKEKIVIFTPLFLILESILALTSILTFFGLGVPFLTPYYGYSLRVQGGIFYLLALGVLVFTRILRLVAVKPLVKKDKRGWRLVYISVLTNGVYDFLIRDFSGLLIIALLSFYLLFQIEDRYH
jgi:hypothetical protein